MLINHDLAGLLDFDGLPDLSPRYEYEKQRYDGWFNNMAQPDWGSVGKYILIAEYLVFMTVGQQMPKVSRNNPLFFVMFIVSFVTLGSRLTRKAPSAYEDGVYMMAGSHRPSPRKLSEAFMKGEDGLPSARNRTALLAFFGQVSTP